MDIPCRGAANERQAVPLPGVNAAVVGASLVHRQKSNSCVCFEHTGSQTYGADFRQIQQAIFIDNVARHVLE